MMRLTNSPLKNRRESENEDFGARARRETGSKVVTFVEDFATQPWRRKTVCSPRPVFQRAVKTLAVLIAISAGPSLAQPGLDANGQCIGDGDGNGSVAINELITAVNNALDGCAERQIEINFAAAIGDESFTCGGVYEGIGSTGATLRLTDFRFYVSNVRMLTPNGDEVPLALEQDGIWQRENVALLDFEDGTTGCSFGNALVNSSVRGTAPAGIYTGVRFDLGIPFELNHGNVETETEPLNVTAMFWNWQGGYKFIRVDGFSGSIEEAIGFNLHVGSTGCASAAPPLPPSQPCTNPNRADITLTGFNPATNVIVADLAAVLADTNVEVNQAETAPGCQAQPFDQDCAGIFDRLGLPFGDQPAGTQRLFRVE